jgi:hypothetical protein
MGHRIASKHGPKPIADSSTHHTTSATKPNGYWTGLMKWIMPWYADKAWPSTLDKAEGAMWFAMCEKRCTPGKHMIVFDFVYDGGGPGKGQRHAER